MTTKSHRRLAAKQPAVAGLAQAVSYESSFHVEIRLPGFNHVVGNPFSFGFDGVDRKIVDHAKNVCSDALGDLKHPS